jgi:hypothetical protein
MSILKHSEIDFKKISYMKPEKQKNIYYSAINYNKNQPLHIQTPKMICKSNGIEVVKKTNPSIEFETMNNDFSFYDFMLTLDDRNVKETFKNNKDWFNKEIPLEVIDDMYKRTNKPVKKDSKPSFSFKLPVIKEKVQCLIYDQKKICLDIQKIIPDSEIIFVIHVRGLKFLKQHYYCDCYISQIKVFLPKEQKYSVLDTYAIDDEEDININNEIIDEEILKELNVEKEAEELKEKKEQEIKIQKQLDEKNTILKNIQGEIEGLQQEFNNL